MSWKETGKPKTGLAVQFESKGNLEELGGAEAGGNSNNNALFIYSFVGIGNFKIGTSRQQISES